jgi:hypothetical protein
MKRIIFCQRHIREIDESISVNVGNDITGAVIVGIVINRREISKIYDAVLIDVAAEDTVFCSDQFQVITVCGCFGGRKIEAVERN